MVKKLLLCFVLVTAMVSSAYAEPHLWSCHYSLAGLTDGHSDYSEARFFRLFLTVDDNNTIAQSQHLSLEGTMTITGGSYSVIDDKVCRKAGNTEQFTLVADMNAGDTLVYVPVDANIYYMNFVEGADGGMNGVNVSWNFPEMFSMNGQGTIPNYRTTQQQLDSFVPYVEYVRSYSDVTGLRWRIVKPSDISTPVSQDYKMRFRVSSVYKTGYDTAYTGTWFDIDAGTSPEGTLTFNEPIAESELLGIRVRLSLQKEETEIYEWRFFNFTEPHPEMWINHVSHAAMTNNKADYSNAEFYGLVLNPIDYTRLAEAKYFTKEGRITIPGGGYTLRDIDTHELLNTIDANMPMTFGLKMADEIGITSDQLEYWPVNGEGRMLEFAGDISSLKGRTVSWTFPAELNMNGQAVIPAFKSTQEQLAQGVPYFELIIEDGNITGINYSLVKAQDISNPVMASYRTDFRFAEYHTSETNTSAWCEVSDGEKWHFFWKNPKPLNTLRYISVRVRAWEEPNTPYIYQWNFYPAEESEESQERSSGDTNTNNTNTGNTGGGSSGGGCTTGFTFAALFLIASLFLTRKH